MTKLNSTYESNNMSLLENFIFEKIGKQFNFQAFKTIEPGYAQLSYADDTLMFLGQGSSRLAWAMSSKKVLKLPIPGIAAGKEQNQEEAKNAKLFPGLVTKVFVSHPDGDWLIAELVRELKSEEEFKEKTGFQFKMLKNFLLVPNPYKFIETLSKLKDSNPEYKAFLNWNQLIEIVKILKTETEESPFLTDMLKVDHWGLTPDGNIVWLDSGLSTAAYNKNYDVNTGYLKPQQ